MQQHRPLLLLLSCCIVTVTLLLVIAVPLEFVILSSVEETVNVPAFKALNLTISRFVAVEAV